MRRGPDARRPHVDLARIGPCAGNKLRNGVGRHRWVYNNESREPDDARDRRDVADEIEIELIIKRRIDGMRRTN